MHFHLYLDESGDHGLTMVDPGFPVFLLCGVIITEQHYQALQADMDALKRSIWNSTGVVFHSRDIRKCEKEFVKLFDLELKQRFYAEVNRIIGQHRYAILASAIRKDRYIRQFGRLSNDVYELAQARARMNSSSSAVARVQAPACGRQARLFAECLGIIGRPRPARSVKMAHHDKGADTSHSSTYLTSWSWYRCRRLVLMPTRNQLVSSLALP